MQVPMSRGDFEAAVQPLLRRVWAVMQRAGNAVFLEWADRWLQQLLVCIGELAAQCAHGGATATSQPSVVRPGRQTHAGERDRLAGL